MTNQISALLGLLQCPACGVAPLESVAQPYPDDLPFEPSGQHLRCHQCKAVFPVTADHIPVLWTPALKAQMLAEPDPESNLGANLQIYNTISDEYLAYTRRLPENALRIRDAARRLQDIFTADTPRYHLDFGCGPGQVLGWLQDTGLTPVGLDVSLANLRNARQSTGALVVCGDATRMPFRADVFGLVTEASVLHHIQDWQAVVREAGRVCHPAGGIVLDAEPSREMVAFSRLAVFVFDLRFPVYRLLSRVWKSKYIFRNTEQAKLNLKAEIHHQPGTGFPLEELKNLFLQAGYELHLFHSPGADLASVKPPKLQNMILNLLSFRNPWNPKFGSFTALGAAPGKQLIERTSR
jgi:ubiquinone/menaquinone biosynthesis C-methylase UbiE/uncharacterized protein YbaR (Trm112 family)